jgi:hypothetical protein
MMERKLFFLAQQGSTIDWERFQTCTAMFEVWPGMYERLALLEDGAAL